MIARENFWPQTSSTQWFIQWTTGLSLKSCVLRDGRAIGAEISVVYRWSGPHPVLQWYEKSRSWEMCQAGSWRRLMVTWGHCRYQIQMLHRFQFISIYRWVSSASINSGGIFCGNCFEPVISIHLFASSSRGTAHPNRIHLRGETMRNRWGSNGYSSSNFRKSPCPFSICKYNIENIAIYWTWPFIYSLFTY